MRKVAVAVILMKSMKSRALSTLLDGNTLMGGRWVGAASGARFDVTDPAEPTRVVGTAPDMDDKDAAIAIGAARLGFEAWRGTTGRERSRALKRWHDAVMEQKDDLAALMTAECGKPLSESANEVAYGCSFLEWFAEEAPRCAGGVDAVAADRRVLTLRQPIGVAAMITPWNFPLAMITRKVGAAVAAGCSTVVKPSEDTPLTALALARLADGCFPDFVLNVVPCSRDNAMAIGETLCASPDVRALSFTGSTAVGKWLYEKSAGTVKKLALELGGNAPFVVLDDADVDLAIKCALQSKFRNAGQTCVCADRFLVHTDVYDAFLDGLLKAEVNVGPLINPRAVSRVNAVLAQAETLDARVHRLSGKDGPSFVPPTIVELHADTLHQADCWAKENFGPVVALAKFEGDDDDALRIANDDSGGLAGYVVSGDVTRGWRFAEGLEVGMVGVNEGIISHCQTNFGGIKTSGLGREGGSRGIDEFLEDKAIILGGFT